MTNTHLLQSKNDCDTIKGKSPLSSTDAQLAKFIRRIQALTDGRHEIIITFQGGVQDWTVRAIGKVEK